jgi:cytochrome c oxidase subunit 3
MPTTQFDSTLERRESGLLGMWAFIATELMFFGPLFFGYVHARVSQHDAFASGSHHMHVALGTLNTALLLTSSLTMALSVQAAKNTEHASLRRWLVVTALLGAGFLGVKGIEYGMEFGEAANAQGAQARPGCTQCT